MRERGKESADDWLGHVLDGQRKQKTSPPSSYWGLVGKKAI